MPDDIMELVEGNKDEDEKEEKSWLNAGLAVAVVIIAGTMAISQTISSNVAQAIVDTKADVLNGWAYYQSKSIKQHLHELEVNDLKLKVLADGAQMEPQVKEAFEKQLQKYESEVVRYEKEKTEIKKDTESKEKDLGSLNAKDDKFDMSDAIFSMSLALFAITALLKNKSLFFLSLLVAAGGGYYMYLACVIK